jgi:predicted alpha/beta hydrolase family esterase
MRPTAISARRRARERRDSCVADRPALPCSPRTRRIGVCARNRVRGVLLVGPSDTEAPVYPPGPSGFAPMPRLPFSSLVVTSRDDIYVSPARARDFAASWGSEVVAIGPAGHINAASGHGPWPEGLALLDRWLT